MGARKARPFPPMLSAKDARSVLGVLKTTHSLETQRTARPRDLALRALHLAKLNETAGASRDVAVGLELDPEHPLVLRAAASILGRNYLKRFLSSPYVTKAARRRALVDLAPASTPVVQTCLHDRALRLSLAWNGAAALDISGTTDHDHIDIFRSQSHPKNQVMAAELVFERGVTHARKANITIGEQVIEIEVPPCKAVASGYCSFPLSQDTSLWIVVPVFNGADALRVCLKSLLREIARTPGARAILLDDGSTDPATQALLQDAQTSLSVHVQRNPVNRGFIETVNFGLAQITQGPVLLLNSDAYLPPGTLARLLAHLDDPEVATVTPLSNNAGSFSIPKANTAFIAPSKAQADALARRAAKQFAGQSVDVLNGNGFCMLISDKARKAVGQLSTAYAQGYYEEVDFCMRASQKGFRHVAAVDCFVSHIGGVSFQGRKKALVSRNQKELYRRFPFYQAAYARFQIVDPLAPYREALSAGTNWVPEEVSQPLPRAPKLDFARFNRPLVLYDAGLIFEDVTKQFPEVRLCPSRWARKYIPQSADKLPKLRQTVAGYEIVAQDRVVEHTAARAATAAPAERAPRSADTLKQGHI